MLMSVMLVLYSYLFHCYASLGLSCGKGDAVSYLQDGVGGRERDPIQGIGTPCGEACPRFLHPIRSEDRSDGMKIDRYLF